MRKQKLGIFSETICWQIIETSEIIETVKEILTTQH